MWAESKAMIVGDFLGKQRNLQFGSMLVLRRQQQEPGRNTAIIERFLVQKYFWEKPETEP